MWMSSVVICQIVPICIWCFFVASVSKFSWAVAQMRRQGTLILVVVGSLPPAKIFFLRTNLLFFISFLGAALLLFFAKHTFGSV